MQAIFDTLSSLIVLAIIAFLAWIVFGGALAKRRNGMVSVYDHETGLRYDKGRLTGALGPGRYATWPAPVTIERIDLREQSLTVSGQEVLSQDNLPVRASALMRWKIVDAIAWKRGGTNVTMRIYEAAQAAMRRRIASHTLDDILADRGRLDDGFAAEIAAALDGAGVAILGADLRDITLAGPAKQAYADLWRAQKEGLAALERARGEQAALRMLANAARMLKGNPELMNLRVLQALAGAPGKTAPSVILGGAPGLAPVSKDVADAASSGGDGS